MRSIVALSKPEVQALSYLPNACAIVSGEATLYLVHGRGYLGQARAVYLLGLGAEARHGKDLPVLDDTLLELRKQDAES
jgi:hypothetical protein